MIITNCKQCGKEFYYLKPSRKRIFCSRKCYYISEKGKLFERRIKINCLVCNKELFVVKSRGNIAKFCSRKCGSSFKGGKHFSPETEFKKGNKTWSIGLTKETDERIKIGTEKRIGIKRLDMLGDKNIAKKPEIRKKISIANTGEKNARFGKKQTNNWMEMRRSQIFPFKDTKIELKIQNFLKLLHIEFLTHYYISEITHAYQCDIFIPSTKTVIECDGDFWHGNKYLDGIKDKKLYDRISKQRELDKIRTKELQEKGFKVLRLWEHEINKMELNDFNYILDQPKL